jgi:hypothetical protein
MRHVHARSSAVSRSFLKHSEAAAAVPFTIQRSFETCAARCSIVGGPHLGGGMAHFLQEARLVSGWRGTLAAQFARLAATNG